MQGIMTASDMFWDLFIFWLGEWLSGWGENWDKELESIHGRLDVQPQKENRLHHHLEEWVAVSTSKQTPFPTKDP